MHGLCFTFNGCLPAFGGRARFVYRQTFIVKRNRYEQRNRNRLTQPYLLANLYLEQSFCVSLIIPKVSLPAFVP